MTSRPRDTTLSSLVEVLAAINTALLAADADPFDDTVRDELAAKFLVTVEAMTQLRARTPRGRRAKAIALQQVAERLLPPPGPFTDLALSLARDLASPLATS